MVVPQNRYCVFPPSGNPKGSDRDTNGLPYRFLRYSLHKKVNVFGTKKNGLLHVDRSFYANFLLCLGSKVIAHVLYGDELNGLGELEAECCLDLHCQQHDGQRVQLEVFHELGLGGDGRDVDTGIYAFNDLGEFFNHDDNFLSCYMGGQSRTPVPTT